MDCGVLDDVLEGGGWYSFGFFDVGYKVGQIVIDEFDQCLMQFGDIDVVGLYYVQSVWFVQKGEEKVFQGGEFVFVFIGLCQCCMDCFF